MAPVTGTTTEPSQPTNRVVGVILLYHRVAESAVDPFGLCVSPHRFEMQMRFLRDRYEVVPLRDLLESARDSDEARRRVAVTFDDGYLDNLTAASPILERAGVPATFFVTTRYLEDPGEYWWDALARVMVEEKGDTTEFLHSLVSRHREILPLELHDRDSAIAALRKTSRPPDDSVRPMRRPEVAALAGRPGHSIGSHTVDHLALQFQSEQVCRSQILESQRILERVVRRRVDELSYPFGGVSAQVIGAADTCQIAYGLLADGGPLMTSPDRLRLSRLPVSPSSDLERDLEEAFRPEDAGRQHRG
jgi:peptidoglycan/xylan/chitin deacetylase (PgdA/CDA1 family)